jgi:hypothetical protein
MDPPPGASPPMRMTASWFGSAWIHRIQVRGAMFRARSRVPLGSVRHLTGVIRRWSFQERPHLAVQRPSACSGVKALRNTSDAKAASRQAALAFRSLDPFRALREPDRRRRDEERPFPVGSRTGAPVGRGIPTVPRFQPPPRRTQHADFPHCAPPFASRQGLWDLSYRGNFRSVVSHSIAVEQS